MAPCICAYHFVFSDVACCHLPCFTNGSLNEPVAAQSFAVVFKSSFGCCLNVSRQLKIDLTVFILVFLIVGLPSVAVKSRVHISIPLHAVGLNVVAFAFYFVFVVK